MVVGPSTIPWQCLLMIRPWNSKSAVPETIRSTLAISCSTVYIKAKVTQGDGTDLASDEVVRLMNLFLHSIFSQVDLSLNGALVTSSTNAWSVVMLETLLSYSHDAKTSPLTSAVTRTPLITWTAWILPTTPTRVWSHDVGWSKTRSV